MKLTWIAVVAVLAGRAYAEDRVEPTGAADNEVLHGDVLVWADATFYAGTGDGAPTVRAAQLDGSRKDHLGDVVAMHVVSVGEDGFVEVEAAHDLACTWSRLDTTDDLTRVRLFVKRADLAPVLTKPFAQTFEDGTQIALRPGVAVIPTADERFVVGVRGAPVVAAVPAGSVGHAYTPDHVKASATVLQRDYGLAPKTHVTLGGRQVELEGSHATAIENRGATTLFSIRMRCAALDVSVPTKSVREIEDDDDGDEDDGDSGLSVLDLREHDFIPPGTVLSSATGHPIAVAAKPIYLPDAPHGKTACVERRVRIGVSGGEPLEAGSDSKLRVCAPASSVVHERIRSASSANGTTRR